MLCGTACTRVGGECHFIIEGQQLIDPIHINCRERKLTLMALCGPSLMSQRMVKIISDYELSWPLESFETGQAVCPDFVAFA